MPDVISDASKDIRDFTYPIATPSLEELGNEVVPEELIRDLLVREWISTEGAPQPIIEVEGDIVLKPNMDTIIISMENYQEQFTGHRADFVDIEVPISLKIHTNVSRQRQRNLMAQCREITYRWKLALRPFQMLYFDGFQAEYLGPKTFVGTMRIRLTAGAIPAFLRHSTGQEVPATEPDVIQHGI